MVKLFLPGGTRFYCSGTMLTHRSVLTAAHCFTGGTSTARQAVGDVVRVGGMGLFDGILSYVEKVDLHPTFDISTYIGDVAVVTLTANIDPRDAARRGVYPAQLGTPSQIRYGSYIRLSGWGVSNKAGRGGGGVARAPPVHAQGAGWPQPGHHARRKKEGRAAKAAKDDDTDDADDADGADDATAWQAAAATRRTVRGRSGGGNRTGVSPRATAAQRAAAGTSTGLSQPMRLLTTQVHVRVMHECATFAERFIGVTNFFTSRYNEALQVCLSLYDGVSACDGDSGAPFFTKFAPPGVPPTYYVHAIMSFSYSSATESCPTYFPDWATRVSAYTDWIVPRLIY
ncbi:hypothetical protein BU14_0696s0006 [Porphyra umbilicalis]|uniref:Peptidase S1 domain-containing protein n=1 Tax=Porphyra umbilicalis TaxID=2786 RepID=A0A1X6NPZ1_PORUM|nr:hypothetical protein BU14_0696s0006 [Porphyra umbilicalis]OSX70657.1 hypothetical protein BU14_0696s0006 [Porphyra umbilicalis]|eukprot:OSX70656.1 hypothetical protein BU14_0696s0006 [Porphyra umbilicalis]